MSRVENRRDYQDVVEAPFSVFSTPVTAAFHFADDTLRHEVVGICEIIVRPGINVDFANCPTRDAEALMGIAISVANASAEAAAVAAVSSPLLDEPVQDAKGVVFNV